MSENKSEAAIESDDRVEFSGGGGGCPFMNGSLGPRLSKVRLEDSDDDSNSSSSEKIIEPVNYEQYLMLDKILTSQHPVSLKHGVKAHDEHLFIVIHQSELR